MLSDFRDPPPPPVATNSRHNWRILVHTIITLIDEDQFVFSVPQAAQAI